MARAHWAEMTANKRNWDARTPIHVRSEFYGVGERDPTSWFAPFEWHDLGCLDGREVVHLQCHLGVETMAFGRHPALRVAAWLGRSRHGLGGSGILPRTPYRDLPAALAAMAGDGADPAGVVDDAAG